MFDLGWSEMGIIALVALIVLGPKELPNALRTVTQVMRSARKLASEFQSGVNEIVREADLEDARQLAKGVSKGSISKAIEKVVDPGGEVKSAINAAEAEAQSAPANPAPPVIPVGAPEPKAVQPVLVERSEPVSTGVQRQP